MEATGAVVCARRLLDARARLADFGIDGDAAMPAHVLKREPYVGVIIS